MKFIVSLFVVLSAVTLVYAQEESASPAGSPEENSAMSMQVPSSLRENTGSAAEATASPAATASATVETPKAQTSASPSASPAAEKKKATAATSDEESSSTTKSAAADTGPDKGKPESVVKRLESEWETAVMKHDSAFIESRVAKDFIGVSSRGKRLNKSALIKEFKADTDEYKSAKNSGLTVRAFDKDVVVASGTAKEVGKAKNGTAFNRSYLFTDTWVLRGDRWQCVASQVMLATGKQ